MLSTDHRVGGLIPTSCCLHVEVSLNPLWRPGDTTEPKIAPHGFRPAL